MLKRRCYYDHKNDLERHVWGRLIKRKFEHYQLCKRCGMRQTTWVDISGIVVSNFKKNYTKLKRNISMKSPLLKALRRQIA